MIYLVSILDKSYAHREMEYTRCFLNRICKKEVARCIRNINEFPKTFASTDWLIVADYKCHPLYNNLSRYEQLQWEDMIETLPWQQQVIWLGDARFKCEYTKPMFAIGSYMSIWEKPNKERYKGFLSCFKQEAIIPVTWKMLIPELPFDYSLSETQCCWDPFILREKEVDLTYIMHGTIKHRLSQLEWLNGLTGTIMVGDWLNRTEEPVKEFVKQNPNFIYQQQKMFGPDWLSLISKARYTIIADDDNKDFPAMLSARFWEAVRADCIPLIYEPKDKQRKIFEGFDNLQTVAYFNTHDDLQRIIALRPSYEECMVELKRFEYKYVGGAL